MGQAEIRTKMAEHGALPLRIRARSLAEGLYSGGHRANTKGSGIEFAGHRAYSPGDDLRHLDRHAQLRHNQLLVRQFHTDTERSIHIICDTSPSMEYADEEGASKLDCALLLAGSLAYIARKGGDDVGLTLLGQGPPQTSFARGQGASLEPLLASLEASKRPPLRSDAQPRLPEGSPQRVDALSPSWEKTLDHLGSTLRRGSIVYVLSDFLDLDKATTLRIAQLATRARTVRATQILTKSETDFPFDGVVRFFDPETNTLIQADAQKARPLYQKALSALTKPLEDRLHHSGGHFLRVSPTLAPDSTLRRIVSTSEEGSL